MSLFGSLKVSTTGLQAQSTKMGAISDNIANVNTVGYKKTEVQFATLVTERIMETRFTPGGVTARPRQVVDLQGTLLGTNTSTDFAISGKGFFITSEEANFSLDQSEALYTRAGSFRPDADGFLRNAAGFYLQGLTTNSDGIPARDGVELNSFTFDDFEPVNVNRISGVAEPTQNLSIRANLPAESTDEAQLANILTYGPDQASTQAHFTQTVQIFDAHGEPHNLSLKWYQVGNEGTASAADQVANRWAVRIDPEDITGTEDDAFAGFFVDTGAARSGFVSGTTLTPTSGTAETVNNLREAIGIVIDSLSDPDNEDAATLQNFINTTNLTANSDIGAEILSVATSALAAAVASGTANVLDAADQIFAAVKASVEEAQAETEDVVTATGNGTSAAGVLNLFSSTAALDITGATAIENEVREAAAFAARQVFDTVQAFVSSAVTAFNPAGGADTPGTANASAAANTITGVIAANAGTAAGAAAQAIALEAAKQAEITAGTFTEGSVLAQIYDAAIAAAQSSSDTTVDANVLTAANEAAADAVANAADGAAFLAQRFAADTVQVTGEKVLVFDFNGDGSLNSVNTVTPVSIADATAGGTVGVFEFDTDTLTVEPQINVDKEGNSANILNRETDITNPVSLVAIGIGDFVTDADEDGDLGTFVQGFNDRFDNPNIETPYTSFGARHTLFEWNVGRPTEVRGSNGLVDADQAGTGLDGITQFDSGEDPPQLETLFVSQDGIRAGLVTGVEIDDEGLITALYDNGATRTIYRLPLASFTNPNGLINVSGNVYQESEESGDVQVNLASQGGTGDVIGSALEQANVELADEFTDMIITQQAFTANTRSITTTDEMLTDINNMIR